MRSEDVEAEGKQIIDAAALVVRMWLAEYGTEGEAHIYMSEESWKTIEAYTRARLTSRSVSAPSHQRKSLYGLPVVLATGMAYGHVQVR